MFAVEPVKPESRYSPRADSAEYKGSISVSLQKTSLSNAGVLLHPSSTIVKPT